MKLDFWQVASGPRERVVAQIAARVLANGERLLVVDGDEERRTATAKALWASDGFLANGAAGEPHADRQPILLSDGCQPANGAATAVIADGVWRDPGEAFERLILLFDADGAPDARKVWRDFDGREDVTRSYFEQEGGKWVKKA